MIPLRTMRIANAALALLLAFLVWRAFGPVPDREGTRGPSSGAQKGAEAAPPPEKPEITRERYNVIEHSGIFKCKEILPTPPPAPTVAPPPPPSLPPVDLELKGTTTSRTDGNVKAIIYNKKTRKTDYYRENDIIPDSGGVKIVTITRTSISLDRQGQVETLDLYPVDLSPLKESTGTKNPPAAQ